MPFGVGNGFYLYIGKIAGAIQFAQSVAFLGNVKWLTNVQRKRCYMRCYLFSRLIQDADFGHAAGLPA